MKSLFNAIIKLRTLFDDIKLMFAELNNIFTYTTYFNGGYSELFTKYLFRYITYTHIVRVCSMVIVSNCIFHTMTREYRTVAHHSYTSYVLRYEYCTNTTTPTPTTNKTQKIRYHFIRYYNINVFYGQIKFNTDV